MSNARNQLLKLHSEISKMPKGGNQPILQGMLELLSDFNTRLESIEGSKLPKFSFDKQEKSAVRESVSSSTVESSSGDVPEFFGDVSVLQEWTGKNSYRVVFDSTKDGLIPAAFNTTTTGITGLMVVVITNDNYVFGTYNSFAVPPPPVSSDTAYIEKDPEFFVFTLKNPHGIPPTKMHRKRVTTTLRICPSDGETVVGASDCFSIFTSNSYFIPTFESYYKDPTGKGADLFTGKRYPTRFNVKRMYAIQWV
ncbi:TLDc domain-containing protein [Entamoeba marina]